MQAPLLQVENLHITFTTDLGTVPAVRGLSYTLEKGWVLAVVGESGSGKTVQALSILNLLPPSARADSGKITYQGKNLLTLKNAALRKIRGRKIAMIFQDPGASLNPADTYCGAMSKMVKYLGGILTMNKLIQAKFSAVRAFLRKNGLDGLLVTDFVDQFYLANFYFYKDEAIFLITPKKSYALTRGLYEKTFGKAAPFMQVIGDDGNRVQNVVKLIQKLGLKKVGFDAAKASYGTGKLFAKNGLLEVPSFISQLRTTKDAQELKYLRAANRLAYLTYEYIKPRIKTGMAENEVAAEMEFFMRKHGAKCTSFFTIVAFGENTADPHYETGTRKLQKEDAILLDFGCVINGYCSDMTRSWWHGNKVPAEYTKIWKIVDNARKQGIKKAKIGVPCKQVDGLCRDLISREDYGEFFTHGTGHGVGIEIHEDPYNNQTSTYVLKEGNIVTVEPGIYLPGKFGVRLEDTVAITKTGAKILTKK